MSNYYCEIHHPNQPKSKYYQAKNRLIRAIKLYKPEYYSEYKLTSTHNYKKNLPYLYLKWTYSFAPNYTKFANKLETTKIYKLNYKETKEALLTSIKTYYPLTYTLIQKENIDSAETWHDFIILSLNALDKTESSLWQAKDIDSWMSISTIKEGDSDEKPDPDITVILNLFRRHEAIETINSMARPRGPKKGADIPSKDNILREKIIQLVKRQSESGKKVNKAAIGRELNLSRERIRVLMKELDLQDAL